MTSDQIQMAVELYRTPFYIYDKKQIIENCNNLKVFSNKIKIFYSLKSNFNPELINVITTLFDIGVETSSDFDYLIAQKLEINKIIHNSIYNNENIYRNIISNNTPINFDNMDVFERFDNIENKKKYNCIIGFRVNFSLDREISFFFNLLGYNSKLGIGEDNIIAAYKKALKSGYRKFGLFAMLASNVIDNSYYHGYINKLYQIKIRIENELEIKFEYIDIGGGFGIDYQSNKKFGIKELNNLLLERFSDLQIIIEPGRYLIGNAGFLVTKIISVKEKRKNIIYLVDGGTNLFVRKAWFNQDHRISYFALNRIEKTNKKSVIYGPLFDNKDLLAESNSMPKLNVGDYIIIHDAGAYGSVRMSNFGTLPHVAELLIEESTIREISKKQSFNEFMNKFNL